METRNLIQATANVVKITNLKVGDVVKQVETAYGSNDIYYGVVTDMLNSGETSFIQILRYKNSYGDITSELKTYEGNKDINIFPASVEDMKKELGIKELLSLFQWKH